MLLFRPLRKGEVGNIAVLVVTIGLSIFVRHLYLLFATGRVQNFPLELERRQTYLFFDMTPRNFNVLIAGIVVMVIIGLLLTYTRLGKAMRAVRDSEELSSISGINSDNINQNINNTQNNQNSHKNLLFCYIFYFLYN